MKSFIALCKATVRHSKSHSTSRMGAAVAYYAVFSIIPLLLLLVAIASIIFDRGEVVRNISGHLTELFGTGASEYIVNLITSIRNPGLGTVSAIVGAIALLLTATGALGELDSDLEELWLVPKRERTTNRTLLDIIIAYVKSTSRLILIVFIGAAMLTLSVAFTILLRDIDGAALIANVVTFVFAIIMFAVMFRLLPTTILPWKELFQGAVITSFLMIVGKILIGLYLARSGSNSAFGTAGSLIGILVWIYYSAQVFFLSASFIFVYSKKYGYLSR